MVKVAPSAFLKWTITALWWTAASLNVTRAPCSETAPVSPFTAASGTTAVMVCVPPGMCLLVVGAVAPFGVTVYELPILDGHGDVREAGPQSGHALRVCVNIVRSLAIGYVWKQTGMKAPAHELSRHVGRFWQMTWRAGCAPIRAFTDPPASRR
jgi:hypothetical protein